jgi:hypothetical protein
VRCLERRRKSRRGRNHGRDRLGWERRQRSRAGRLDGGAFVAVRGAELHGFALPREASDDDEAERDGDASDEEDHVLHVTSVRARHRDRERIRRLDPL